MDIGGGKRRGWNPPHSLFGGWGACFGYVANRPSRWGILMLRLAKGTAEEGKLWVGKAERGEKGKNRNTQILGCTPQWGKRVG